jgi:hypothetical protein
MNPGDPRSEAGAIGPLQVIPRLHCIERDERGRPLHGPDGERRIYIPVEECNLIAVGVAALNRYLQRLHGDRVMAVARYNDGRNPDEESIEWAEEVVNLADQLNH